MPGPKQSAIQQAITQAKKAIKQGKIGTAIEIYTAILQQQPNHPAAKKTAEQVAKGITTKFILGRKDVKSLAR